MQDLLFFMEKFEGHNTGVGHDTNSRDLQEINAWANQQEQQAPEDAIYDNGTAQHSYNKINMKMVRQTQVLLLLLQV